MFQPKDRERRRFRPGAPPGEVAEDDVDHHEPSVLTVFRYDGENLEEVHEASLEEALAAVEAPGLTWINVDGLGDLEVLETLWDRFSVHPLIREDIVSTRQRPKFEEYPDQDFLVLRMVSLVEDCLEGEQVSIVFGEGWLVSFQERRGDVFNSVRTRLREGRPRIRRAGADYLAYALLDATVDEIFPILETYGEWIEEMETEAFEDPDEGTLTEIHDLKRDMLTLRRTIWPLRDAIASMQRTEGSDLISEETRTFLRDAYDHTVRVMDMVETYRELTSSVADVYYSALSHRMNEVMKVLTIVATIFIPLTFIAGIYGMNFDPEISPWNMPELGWTYGYPASLAAMLVVALGMVVMFQRRGWL